MTKKIVFTFISVCVLVLLIIMVKNCRGERHADREQICISIEPLRFLIDPFLEDQDVLLLVPPGVSPETYEPTPQQLMQLSGNARLFFSTGLMDFERELAKKLAENADIELVDLSNGLTLLEGSCTDHGDHTHGHGIDPHTWLSPLRLKRMAVAVCNSFSVQFPEQQEKYISNLQQIISDLETLDMKIRDMLAESSIKSFLIFHPALTYYAEDYGLKQLVVEQDGKEPSAEWIINVVEEAKAAGITKIFYQREFSRTVVETIAKDLKAEVIEIDPLSSDIYQNLLEITKLISQ